ncbi:GntR family transcriptional regulator [Corticibacterium sp. UT-5YL-CI-8]|nr:GntR family transcriptional regulator [Tianweitania sp. UT-5YL-CI-8]
MDENGEKPSSGDVRGHRYRDIANDLFAAIKDGRYALGDRLPTEQAISTQYDVSRHTARHAVQELERLGLVTRNKGGGTVVVKTDPNPRFINSISSIEDLMQYAATARFETLRTRNALALPQIETLSGRERPDEWGHAEGLRYVDGSDRPVCWTDVFLHPDVSDIMDTIGHTPRPIYSLIEERHQIAIHSISQTIEAISIAGDIAAGLYVRPGSAGLKITRAYHDIDKRVLEIAVNIYPAANFSYRMTILRGQPREP